MTLIIATLVLLAQALDLGTSLYSRLLWPTLLEKTVTLQDSYGRYSISKGLAYKFVVTTILLLQLRYLGGPITNTLVSALSLYVLWVGIQNFLLILRYK